MVSLNGSKKHSKISQEINGKNSEKLYLLNGSTTQPTTPTELVLKKESGEDINGDLNTTLLAVV